MEDNIFNKNPLPKSSLLNDAIDSKLVSEHNSKVHTANIIVINKRSLPESDDENDDNQDALNCKTNKKQKLSFCMNIEPKSLDQSNDQGISYESNEGSPKSKRKREWNFQNVFNSSKPFSSNLFFFGSERCPNIFVGNSTVTQSPLKCQEINDCSKENSPNIFVESHADNICDPTNYLNQDDVCTLVKDENHNPAIEYYVNDVSAHNGDSTRSDPSDGLSNVQMELCSNYDKNNVVQDNAERKNLSTHKELICDRNYPIADSDDLFSSKIFFFGSEDCRDPLFHSFDCHKTNGSRISSTSMENFVVHDSIKENRTMNTPFKEHNATTQSINNDLKTKTCYDKILESSINSKTNKKLLEKSGNLEDKTMLENEKNIPYSNTDKTFKSNKSNELVLNTENSKTLKTHNYRKTIRDSDLDKENITQNIPLEEHTETTKCCIDDDLKTKVYYDRKLERSWIDRSECLSLELSVSPVYRLEYYPEDIIEYQTCENNYINGKNNEILLEKSGNIVDETMLEDEKNTPYINMDKTFESDSNKENRTQNIPFEVHNETTLCVEDDLKTNTLYDRKLERSLIDQSECLPFESSVVSPVYRLEYYPEDIIESQTCKNNFYYSDFNNKSSILSSPNKVDDETTLSIGVCMKPKTNDGKSLKKRWADRSKCFPLESSVSSVHEVKYHPEDIVESQTCKNRCNTSIDNDGTDQQNYSMESIGLNKRSIAEPHKKSSPVSSDVELDSHDSQSSDDLLWLLPPSKKCDQNSLDKCTKNVKLIQNKSHNTIDNEKIVSQNELSLKLSEKSQFIPVDSMTDRSGFLNFKNSSFVKGTEDKFDLFYDCDLSSIADDSYLESDVLLSLSSDDVELLINNSDSDEGRSRTLNSPINVCNDTIQRIQDSIECKTNNGEILKSLIVDDTTGTDQQNCSFESNSPEKHFATDLHKNISQVISRDAEQDGHHSSCFDDLSWLLPPKMKSVGGSQDNEKKVMKLTRNKSYETSQNQGIVSQREPRLKLSDESQLIVNSTKNKTDLRGLKNSSFVKGSENKIDCFYDCDLSSIEDSLVENDLPLLLSYENVKNPSLDNGFFDGKSESIINCGRNGSTICFHEKPHVQSSKSLSANNCMLATVVENNSCVSSSKVENNSSFIHTSYDHKYTKKVMGRDCSKEIIQINTTRISTSKNCVQPMILDKTDKNLGLDVSNGKLSEENSVFRSYSNKTTLPYVASCAQKSHVDNVSERLNVKTIKNCAMPDINTEMDVEPSDCVKEKNLCSNETDKKPSTNRFEFEDDSVMPHLSQCLKKSTSSQSVYTKALATKASTNINLRNMGDQALNTYLAQQLMTTSVLKVMYKSLETCPSSGILLDDPTGLVMPLMPHQKHALAWLMWRERQEPKGGILADDMGLGKTLSMISLVLKSAEEKQNSGPVVSAKDGSNNTVSGGTLVVCPASLISQWENEARTKLNRDLLKVQQYYGANRTACAKNLTSNDMVITSYNAVMWDYKKQKKSSPLFKIKWDRIILDEAHCIRNHKTQTCIAVCNMSSRNRWAITGTPIHNKEADFFTLLKFVGCQPFDEWVVWKRWVGNNDDLGKHRLALFVKALMLRRTKQELSEFTTFKLPSKNFHTIDIELSKEERNAYEKLLQFSSNMFATYLYERATKEKVLNGSFEVPCKVQYFQEKTDEKEKVFKDHPELLKLFRQFKNIQELQTHHILVLLLRLRQICCHPCLIKGALTEDTFSVENMKEEKLFMEDNINTYNDETDISPLIENTTSNLASNSTTAMASDPCDTENLAVLMSHLTMEEKPTLIDSNMIFQKSWPSSKVKIVSDYVWEKVLKNNGKDKAIIVSQWPSMLFLIRQYLLTKYAAKMEMYAGYVPILKRSKIVQEFNDSNGGPQILLLSLTTGGVGLNLMAANHMFLVDVHWNPQLEAQACDRIFRVGQTKPVNVYKFVCTNTIETRILLIQSRKLQIAENLFNGVGVTSSKITLDDLKQIFQIN